MVKLKEIGISAAFLASLETLTLILYTVVSVVQ